MQGPLVTGAVAHHPGGRHCAEPLENDGLRERYLPEVAFRSRVDHRDSRYALYAAACAAAYDPTCGATLRGFTWVARRIQESYSRRPDSAV